MVILFGMTTGLDGNTISARVAAVLQRMRSTPGVGDVYVRQNAASQNDDAVQLWLVVGVTANFDEIITAIKSDLAGHVVNVVYDIYGADTHPSHCLVISRNAIDLAAPQLPPIGGRYTKRCIGAILFVALLLVVVVAAASTVVAEISTVPAVIADLVCPKDVCPPLIDYTISIWRVVFGSTSDEL